jgi:hypothetical protein
MMDTMDWLRLARVLRAGYAHGNSASPSLELKVMADECEHIAQETLDELGYCPGGGMPWASGSGIPICPGCHGSPVLLKVPRPPSKFKGRFTGTIPAHRAWEAS